MCTRTDLNLHLRIHVMAPSVDSSFFLIPLLLMNELVKAVLALALSAAAAVWLLGVALQLW
ncbi:MAG: hypothetical protein ACO2PN_22345, partial [Pyrobaculum sp.]